MFGPSAELSTSCRLSQLARPLSNPASSNPATIFALQHLLASSHDNEDTRKSKSTTILRVVVLVLIVRRTSFVVLIAFIYRRRRRSSFVLRRRRSSFVVVRHSSFVVVRRSSSSFVVVRCRSKQNGRTNERTKERYFITKSMALVHMFSTFSTIPTGTNSTLYSY